MAGKSKKKKQTFQKVVSELFPVSERRGGGLIKIEAWEEIDGKVVKYSMAYINHRIYAGDNGRVFGYDNTHHHHHKHYFGQVTPVEDFTNYQDLVKRFEIEIREFIK
jgi:hypothetical protein